MDDNRPPRQRGPIPPSASQISRYLGVLGGALSSYGRRVNCECFGRVKTTMQVEFKRPGRERPQISWGLTFLAQLSVDQRLK
jgi:hypothetical protein